MLGEITGWLGGRPLLLKCQNNVFNIVVLAFISQPSETFLATREMVKRTNDRFHRYWSTQKTKERSRKHRKEVERSRCPSGHVSKYTSHFSKILLSFGGEIQLLCPQWKLGAVISKTMVVHSNKVLSVHALLSFQFCYLPFVCLSMSFLSSMHLKQKYFFLMWWKYLTLSLSYFFHLLISSFRGTSMFILIPL